MELLGGDNICTTRNKPLLSLYCIHLTIVEISCYSDLGTISTIEATDGLATLDHEAFRSVRARVEVFMIIVNKTRDFPSFFFLHRRSAYLVIQSIIYLLQLSLLLHSLKARQNANHQSLHRPLPCRSHHCCSHCRSRQAQRWSNHFLRPEPRRPIMLPAGASPCTNFQSCIQPSTITCWALGHSPRAPASYHSNRLCCCSVRYHHR